MVRALAKGWGFQDLKFNENRVQRHSLWVHNPVEDGWRCHKVDASIRDDYLNPLLDEAGVPR